MFRFMIKFLKILGIACAIGVLIRISEVLIIKYNENKVEETQQVTELINDKIVAESKNNIEDTMENIELVSENKTTKEEKTSNSKNIKEAEQIVPKANKKAETSKKEETKTETKKETIVEKKEETTEIIEEKKEEKVEEKKQEETPIIKKEDKQEETKEDKQEDIITEEYKINNQMINQLKETIKNNETEEMKNYGYEIVVDSSIVEITNQFTFTEYRVKNKLALKYGTIRIYARDYYYNGTYITTQCFII